MYFKKTCGGWCKKLFYSEYMAPTKKQFNTLAVASRVCLLSPRNILLLGGGAVLPQITGFKQLRGRSDDLDFVVNNAGFQAVSSSYALRKESEIRDCSPSHSGVFTYLEDIFVGFFIEHIRGYPIPAIAYALSKPIHTNRGIVYSVPPELNIALKIRRGLQKGHIYGKDGCDFASLVVGSHLRGRDLDYQLLSRSMSEGVCDTCALTSPYQCIDELEKGKRNLAREYFPIVEEAANACRSSLTCKLAEN